MRHEQPPHIVRSIADISIAMAQLLRARLDDIGAETVTLTREEAALLLGLVAGVAEYMKTVGDRP